MALAYFDFQLKIERSEQGFVVDVPKSLAGAPHLCLPPPGISFDLDTFLAGIGRPARSVAPGARALVELAGTLRTFGTHLYDTFFPGEVDLAFRTSLREAHDLGAGLRIRLSLAGAPELAALPWEYLYDPLADDFVARSTSTPLLRCPDLLETIRPLAVDLPLRVLVATVGPAEAEWQSLQGAVSDLNREGLVTVERLEGPGLSRLPGTLGRGVYHVLHLVYPSEIGAAGGSSTEDGVEVGRPATAADLTTLVHDGRGTLRLVVMERGDFSPALAPRPFPELAHNLLQAGIPAVVALQLAMADGARSTFAAELYRRLAHGLAIDEALGEVRKALSLRGHTPDWGAPALFMRTADGQIFEVAAQQAAVRRGVVAPPGEGEPVPGSAPPARRQAVTASDEAMLQARVNPKILKWFVDRTRQQRIFELMLDQKVQKQVMLVEAPTHMGKTWLINFLFIECLLRRVPVAHFDLDLLARRPLDYLTVVRHARDQLGPDFFAEMTKAINMTTTEGTARVTPWAGGRIDPDNPPYIPLRKLLRAAYDPRALSRLSEKQPFVELRYRFSPGDNLDEMIDEILEFCRTGLRWEALLDAVMADAPPVYQVFAAQQAWTTGPTAVASAQADTAVRDNLGSVGIDSDSVRSQARVRIMDAFFRCLANLSDEQIAVFLVDAYENASDDARQWIEDELLYRIRLDRLPQVLVVIAGQKVPATGDDLATFVIPTDLERFAIEHVTQYLELRGLASLDADEIYQKSEGYPHKVSNRVEEVLLGL